MYTFNKHVQARLERAMHRGFNSIGKVSQDKAVAIIQVEALMYQAIKALRQEDDEVVGVPRKIIVKNVAMVDKLIKLYLHI